MFPLSMARKLAVAALTPYRVVSTGLKICPVSGCTFMPNFPNFLPQCRPLCLALPPCSLWTWVFQGRQIGCSCFADDCFCVFPVCLVRYPDSIGPTELSIQYLHLLRHSWFVTQYCSVDFQHRLQLVFATTQDPLVLLTHQSRLRAQDISNISGDDRTERLKPYQLKKTE